MKNKCSLFVMSLLQKKKKKKLLPKCLLFGEDDFFDYVNMNHFKVILFIGPPRSGPHLTKIRQNR